MHGRSVAPAAGVARNADSVLAQLFPQDTRALGGHSQQDVVARRVRESAAILASALTDTDTDTRGVSDLADTGRSVFSRQRWGRSRLSSALFPVSGAQASAQTAAAALLDRRL